MDKRTAITIRKLDLLKVEMDKKERKLSEALIQARRMAEETEELLKLKEGLIQNLESEMETYSNEKDLALRADFNIAIQSREALLLEVDEILRNQN